MSSVSSVSTAGQVQELSPFTNGGRIDPYAIFALNFKALGGEKEVKKDTTTKYKGELKINDVTFQYQEAYKKPLKSLKVISSNFRVLYRGGDDGKNIWASQDGDVKQYTDEDSPKREIDKLWEEWDYTNPKSRHFKVTAGRQTNINGTNCFEVVIKNNRTDEVVKHYYDSKTFLLKRELRESSAEITQTDFSDYKSVGGVLMAHKKDTLFMFTGNTQSITWDKIERGIFLADTLFEAPEQKIRLSDLAAMTGTGSKVDTYA